MPDSDHLYPAEIAETTLFVTLNKSRKILRFFFLLSIIIFAACLAYIIII